MFIVVFLLYFLSGCFSAGATLDDALPQAEEAIECYLEGILLDEEPMPTLHSIEYHHQNPDYADGIWALVAVDLAKISGQPKRINITLPERLLSQMDQFAANRAKPVRD